MKLYLAGPMSGHEQNNYPAFDEAAGILRSVGYEVRSPTEQGVSNGAQPGSDQYEALVRAGMAMVPKCDGLALMPGWQESKGAVREEQVAQIYDLPALYVEEWIALAQMPLKWAGESKFKPQRQYRGDAGFDLVCAEGTIIQPGEFKDIDCGITMEMPPGVWGLLTGRSSTLRRKHLLVAQGVIDNGYRGPLFAGVWNLNSVPVQVNEGERLAQLIPMPLVAARLALQQVAEGSLSYADRGEQAFGSTGA